MKEIKKVIELYVEGTRTGNVKLLKCLFHEEAIMSGDLGENKLVVATPNIFFEDINGQIAESCYRYKIYGISRCGEIASAKLKEFGLKGHDFLNMFQLQRIDGEWKIISKLFTTADEGTYESV